MGERLSSVEQESTVWPPVEVIEAQSAVKRSIAAQAEMELRRNARTRQTRSAAAQASSEQATVSRLQRSRKSSSGSSEGGTGDKKSAKIIAVSAAGTAVVGGMALAGVGEVLALASQPLFLGAGAVAAAGTYFASGYLTSSRTKFAVEAVELIHPGTVAVHIETDAIDELGVEPGQSAEWQFDAEGLKGGSIRGYLSCVPQGNFFRVVFLVDDDTANSLRLVTRGTKVTVKNPDGIDPQSATRQKSLIIAIGDGIVPMRAMFETVPGGPGQVTMMYRTGRAADVLFIDELKEVGAFRKAKLNVIVGAPTKFPRNMQPLCADHLAATVPDIRSRNVFVAGPNRMTTAVVKNLRELGVPTSRIHVERV